MSREFGEQHGADGDADDAQRQLVEPIGIVDDRHDLVGARRDDGADEDVDLGDAARDDGRHGQHPELADLAIEPRQADARQHAGTADGDIDQRKLRDTAQHGGDGDPERSIGRFERQ